jgi:hypothetical protein
VKRFLLVLCSFVAMAAWPPAASADDLLLNWTSLVPSLTDELTPTAPTRATPGAFSASTP